MWIVLNVIVAVCMMCFCLRVGKVDSITQTGRIESIATDEYSTTSNSFCLVGNLLLCLSTLSESMFKPTCHGFHVTHTSSSSCATTLGLLSPHVSSLLFGWVGTGRARFLLNMIRDLSTPTASRVRLVVPLSK